MEIKLSKKSVDLIVFAEVSSPAYYNKFLQSPVWPKGESGVTIGVGYDLGQVTKEKITKDWGNDVSPKELAIIVKCAGLKGTKAQAFLKNNADVKALKIPFDTARNVFYDDMLPKYVKSTAAIYPGLEELEPDAAGALVSMVFNRGASLEGSSRSEMAAIKPLVPQKNYTAIAALVDHSKRLWVGKDGMAGVVKRRELEAAMIKNAVRTYTDEELLTITI